jgi:putative ABC transport system permease protein
MGFYLSVAFKNVFRQKKRSFTLGINYTIVSFILVLLLSFSEGARINITSNVAQSNAGHITISGNYAIQGKAYKGILEYPKIKDIVTAKFGTDTEVFVRYIMRSAVYNKGISKRLQFTGIDTNKDTGFKDQIEFIKGGWDAFAETPNGVIIPLDVAKYFEIDYDDDILISTRTRFGAFNTGTLKIKGIYRTVNFFIQGVVLSHFDFLRSLDLAEKDAASTMYIYFTNPANLGERRDLLMKELAASGFVTNKPKNDAEALDAISAASPRYEKVDSDKTTITLTLATLDEALGLVKNIVAAVNGIGFFIALVMLFIIAVSILINLRMTINDRLQEIGTMRTIGVEAGTVTRLFMLENVILALIFIAIGMACALVIVALFSFVIPMPSQDVLSLFVKNNHLVLVPAPGSLFAVSLAIVLFSALFSFFPARFGGKIKPVDALNRVF